MDRRCPHPDHCHHPRPCTSLERDCWVLSLLVNVCGTPYPSVLSTHTISPVHHALCMRGHGTWLMWRESLHLNLRWDCSAFISTLFTGLFCLVPPGFIRHRGCTVLQDNAMYRDWLGLAWVLLFVLLLGQHLDLRRDVTDIGARILFGFLLVPSSPLSVLGTAYHGTSRTERSWFRSTFETISVLSSEPWRVAVVELSVSSKTGGTWYIFVMPQ